MYFLFFVLFQPPLLFDSSLFYSKFSLVPRIGAQYQKLYLFFILSLSPSLFIKILHNISIAPIFSPFVTIYHFFYPLSASRKLSPPYISFHRSSFVTGHKFFSFFSFFILFFPIRYSFLL